MKKSELEIEVRELNCSEMRGSVDREKAATERSCCNCNYPIFEKNSNNNNNTSSIIINYFFYFIEIGILQQNYRGKKQKVPGPVTAYHLFILCTNFCIFWRKKRFSVSPSYIIFISREIT